MWQQKLGIIRRVGVNRVSWDPNTKHGDLHTGYKNSGTPLNDGQHVEISHKTYTQLQTLILDINRRSSTITAVRLMMICIRSWISQTQQKRPTKSAGTLVMISVFQNLLIGKRRVTLGAVYHPGAARR